MMQADDWAAALGGYPQWAIEKAARWWKGEENPDRRKKPLEGDIAARCKIEVMPARFGPQILANNRKLAIQPPPKDITAEERAARAKAAAEIVARFKGVQHGDQA
jgi:hypothetical protein